MEPDQYDSAPIETHADGVLPLSQAELSRRIRRRLGLLLSDESEGDRSGIAIYTLADPRDVRCVRYVGQTCNPARRYQQHVRTARLWLAAETPWWIRLPRLRGLYIWIRQLYADEMRLPFMLVTAWSADQSTARQKERQLVERFATMQMPLLNFEAQLLRRADEPARGQIKRQQKKRSVTRKANRTPQPSAAHDNPAGGIPPPAGCRSQT